MKDSNGSIIKDYIMELPEDIQKELVFEEAHGSVSHLQMRAGDTLDDSLEDLGDQRLKLREITTDFQNIHQLCQEQSLFNVVSEGPIFQQPVNQRESQTWIFAQKQH